MYVIWSFEHKAWWKPARRGYTENLGQAGRYDEAEAGLIVVRSIMMEEVAVLEQVAKREGPPAHHPYRGKK